MKILDKFNQLILPAALALLSLVASSCSMMTEEEPDCNPYYKVRFRYDMNMLHADAFSSQVSEVNLHVFDRDGRLVASVSDSGDALAEEGYMLDLDVAPGVYDMVAWCGNSHPEAEAFEADGGDSPLTFDDLCMKLRRKRDDDGTAHSTTDLHDLYHGKLTAVDLPDEAGVHVVDLPLTKNTNSVRVMLVHLSGKEIKKDDFDFKITDASGYLGHDNTILPDESIEFRAWAKTEAYAQTAPPAVPGYTQSRASTAATLIAEMTTSRLQTCNNPVLTVTRRSDGLKIIETPLLDYLLMYRREFHKSMPDNEFLDREDDYPMTFFLRDDDTWYRSVIDILSWRVVMQDTDI